MCVSGLFLGSWNPSLGARWLAPLSCRWRAASKRKLPMGSSCSCCSKGEDVDGNQPVDAATASRDVALPDPMAAEESPAVAAESTPAVLEARLTRLSSVASKLANQLTNPTLPASQEKSFSPTLAGHEDAVKVPPLAQTQPQTGPSTTRLLVCHRTGPL